MAESLIVNLEELSRLLQPRVSVTTLRAYVAEAETNGLPIVAHGTNGRGYEFDLAAVATWWAAFQAKRDRAKEERNEQLALFAAELYGERGSPDAGGRTMSPADRKQLAEAIRAEDYNRARRGELLERAEYEQRVTAAVIETRTAFLQLSAEAAKRLGLTAEQTRLLDDMVQRRVNGLADKLGLEAPDNDNARDTAAA